MRGLQMNSIIKICATFLIAMLSIIFLSCNSPNNDISTSNLQEANASENELAPIVNNYIEEGRMIVEETEPENGILVIGEGSLKVNPDIAVVNMGIQVERRTASNARKEAAISMQNLLDAITEIDVEDKDVQTSYFNISPRYDWIEEQDAKGRHVSRQVLVGYTVSNNVIVTVRNLDNVSKVIDSAAEASGDSIRINNVSFQIDNAEQYEAELRKLAYVDALAKATHFSSLAGVKLGEVMMISEVSSAITPVMTRSKMAFAEGFAGDYSTPINPGETDLDYRVSVFFRIK